MKERQRLPRRREELTEEGDLPLERSKHVCRAHHQTTDCDARESGIPPDAAGHQTRQEQQWEQQAKTPAPAGVTVAAQKVAAPAAVEAGHAIPPDAAAEAVTPAKTPGAPREEEPDKLMKNLASSCKNRRESGNGRPSRTGGTPAAAPGHRRLRDKRLHTLLGPTSGQPSCFHGPQAGRRSRKSHA